MRTLHLARLHKSPSLILPVAALLACLPTVAQPTTGPKGLPPDLKKVRALLVVDTASNLKESVTHDRQNMETILRCFIPEKMREITVLDGKKVTRQGILEYYRQLRTGPDETLLFFYAGHAKLDDKNRHLFQIQEGEIDPIRRDEVLQAMKAKNPGLIVLLTDCCSVKTRPTSRILSEDRPLYETYPHPVLHCLFFQHRGVVDITATQDGTGSWGDDKRGGIFTQSLCGLFRERLPSLDLDKNGFVSWKEFFGLLERRTQETFEKWCEQMRTTEKMDIKKQQRAQKPKAWSPLPEPPFSLAKSDIKSDKKAFAVVSLINKTGKTLTFTYRWTKQDKWSDARLEKNGKLVLHKPVRGDLTESQLPRLEVEIPSEKIRDALQPRKWIGAGKPSVRDGREIELTSK